MVRGTKGKISMTVGNLVLLTERRKKIESKRCI